MSTTIFRYVVVRLACPVMRLYTANLLNVSCTLNNLMTYHAVNNLMLLVWIFDTAPVESHPCSPSPCGPNSQCREINVQSVCSCLVGFVGSPPTCRPECIVDSDCNLNEACSNQKCRNPCIGTCGVGANCKVFNHKPICTCRPGLTGDPFTRCHEIRE